MLLLGSEVETVVPLASQLQLQSVQPAEAEAEVCVRPRRCASAPADGSVNTCCSQALHKARDGGEEAGDKNDNRDRREPSGRSGDICLRTESDACQRRRHQPLGGRQRHR